MSENKFDIEKFWDDFLAEEDDGDVEPLDTADNKEKVDVFSAESNDDLTSEKLIDKQNELSSKISENNSARIEKQNNSIDENIKPIDANSLNDFENFKPVMAEDSVDRIKKDESILDTTKDEKLEKEYMRNLSNNDRKEIDKILNQDKKVEKQEQVKVSNDDDDLASFRELEKQLQNKPKSENKNPNKFMQKIKTWLKKQNDKELIANSSKAYWFTMLGLASVFLIGLIAIIIILSI